MEPRIYYELRGAHYHCRVFYNGKLGDLVFAEDELDAMKQAFNGCSWIEEKSV